MLRQIKPRNAASKRALEKKEPKVKENPKMALFLRGTSASEVVQTAMADLAALRQPLVKKFTKKNALHPFEDASSLEFFSSKNDASLICFGSSSKKRPHALTLVRMFDHHVLDMLELCLIPDTFRRIEQFKNHKFAIGMRPMLLFASTAFESPVPNEWTLARSLLMDYFRGETHEKVDVEGLQVMIVISADEPSTSNNPAGPSTTTATAATSRPNNDDPSKKPRLHLRVYRIRTRRSGQQLPRVETEEIGPRMDFFLGRTRDPDEALLKGAMRTPRGARSAAEPRTKKNVSTDAMGDKLGRIHLGRQDLGQLQSRKMKALKRGRGGGGGEEGEAERVAVSDNGDVDERGGEGGGGAGRKKRKV